MDHFKPHFFSVSDVSEQHRGHLNFKENVVDNKIRELDIHTYLTALLENLGDYYTHSNHEIVAFEEVLKKSIIDCATI